MSKNPTPRTASLGKLRKEEGEAWQEYFALPDEMLDPFYERDHTRAGLREKRKHIRQNITKVGQRIYAIRKMILRALAS